MGLRKSTKASKMTASHMGEWVEGSARGTVEKEKKWESHGTGTRPLWGGR
jgi:hypothetical protein